MTYAQLLEKMKKTKGANLADVALCRMMDMVSEESGEWPDWDDIAPQWVVDLCR